MNDIHKEVLEIPVINNTTVKYFVDNEYVGEVTTEQCAQIRQNVVEYILETGDESILDSFYFIGHEDTNNDVIGKEIKFNVEDKYGNLSTLPWEINHIRRYMMKLTELGRKLK